MQLVPRFNDQVITANDVIIHIDPAERQRISKLVAQTSDVLEVHDEASYAAARNAAGQLKAKLDEIESARKATKQAFDAVARSIQELARDVSGPVKAEQDRILALLAGHVAKLEAAKKEQERATAEAKRLEHEEANRKMMEAQAAKDAARVAQLELEMELASEVEDLGRQPERGLIPDGRVNHDYEFALLDVNATVRAGCWRLLRWELDIMACKDSVKSQLELNPDAEPTLPGIKITPKLKVSVKASARIR